MRVPSPRRSIAAPALALLLLAGGCATDVRLPALPDCHPANPAHPVASAPAASTLLDEAAPMPSAEPRVLAAPESHQHGEAETPASSDDSHEGHQGHQGHQGHTGDEGHEGHEGHAGHSGHQPAVEEPEAAAEEPEATGHEHHHHPPPPDEPPPVRGVR